MTTLEQHADRAVKAKRIADNAKRRASRIAADQAVNRSTRARQALKVKADALDEVAAALAGRG